MYCFLCVTLLFALCNAQELASEETVFQCNARNAYYKVEGSCDAYYECTDYEPFLMLCPDGLNYNPKTKWPMYPCSYPNDVPCVGRDTSQPAKPTAHCPRQYGFFKSPLNDANHCGQYRLCADGHAYDMFCPFGLAFDIRSATCNWPDLVPGCNYEEFIGFICPVPEYDTKGNPVTVNFEYDKDCKMFYSCQSGRARILSCEPGLAFDPEVGRCEEHGFAKCVAHMNGKDGASKEDAASKEDTASKDNTASREDAADDDKTE